MRVVNPCRPGGPAGIFASEMVAMTLQELSLCHAATGDLDAAKPLLAQALTTVEAVWP